MKDFKVFVQLASYRDPQLIPTIRSALQNAKYPERLNFGICWQRDKKESLKEFEDHPQVRYQDIDYRYSKGLGWARSKVAELYEDEDFTLQLDSHHRFAKDWDVMLYEDYKQASQLSTKPIITTYLTPFETEGDNLETSQLTPTPCLMSQYEFSSDKLLMSMPWYIQDYKDRTHVIRARTLSGHFIFTKSDFLKEVPYDPDIYFGGYCEETSMSVRAWTSGYDFFSPYRQYIWHEYTRKGRPKHWDDHSKKSKTKITSGERDALARDKVRQLFQQEDNNISLEGFGLGNIRTLKQYEDFCGFDFKNCELQDYTFQVKEPPNPIWDKTQKPEFKYIDIEWDVNHFKNQQVDKKIKVITLGIVDKQQENLVRKDFTIEEHPSILDFSVNNLLIEVDIKKAKKLIMYGLFTDDSWSEPYIKEFNFL